MGHKSLNSRLKELGKVYWWVREIYVRVLIFFKRFFDRPTKLRKRILFFNVMGLGYSGTDKFLQVLAKNLNKERYDVYFMYSDKEMPSSGVHDVISRLSYLLDGKVFPIRFEYEKRQSSQPYFIEGMSPDIFKVIKDFKIDLLVTAGAGHAEYPFCSVRNIPVILINVFGEPNMQDNLTFNVCISNEVANKLSPIVPLKKVKVMWVPSEGPPSNSPELGKRLRHELGIPDQDIVFGRIGRSNDGIFDPIGIKAFQQIVKKHLNAHYLIISPPPALEKIIKEEKIPNVHFAPPSGKEENMWSFYEAMDVLAHFRKDGESFGLNIAEAMFCAKPVISHKSRFWNAHLEYLKPEFSFVAEVDDVAAYASFMEFFVADSTKEKRSKMGEKAREFAQNNFHIRHHIGNFESYIEESLSYD